MSARPSREGVTVKPTKTGEVSKLCRVIGHGSHDPVREDLPHSIQDTEEEVKNDPWGISIIANAESWPFFDTFGWPSELPS